MAILSWLGGGLKAAGGLLFPFFARPRWGSLGPVLGWTLHLLLWALILVGLYLLNNYVLDLPRALHSTWPALYPVWLPLLAVLLYLLLWLAGRLRLLLRPGTRLRSFAAPATGRVQAPRAPNPARHPLS